jgi:hypothetical protein
MRRPGSHRADACRRAAVVGCSGIPNTSSPDGKRITASSRAGGAPCGVSITDPSVRTSASSTLDGAHGFDALRPSRGNLDRHGVHFLTAYVAGV